MELFTAKLDPRISEISIYPPSAIQMAALHRDPAGNIYTLHGTKDMRERSRERSPRAYIIIYTDTRFCAGSVQSPTRPQPAANMVGPRVEFPPAAYFLLTRACTQRHGMRGHICQLDDSHRQVCFTAHPACRRVANVGRASACDGGKDLGELLLLEKFIALGLVLRRRLQTRRSQKRTQRLGHTHAHRSSPSLLFRLTKRG